MPLELGHPLVRVGFGLGVRVGVRVGFGVRVRVRARVTPPAVSRR
jgi:hypothetical protein